MNGRAERDSTSIQRGPPDPPMHRPSTPRAEARAPACPAVERAAPSAPCNKTTVCDTRPFQEALNRNGRPMGSCQDRLTGAGVPAAAPSAALATRGRNVRLEATLFGPNNSGAELFGEDDLSRPHISAPSCAAEISSTIRPFRTFRPNISAGRIVRVRNIEYNLWPNRRIPFVAFPRVWFSSTV